MDRWSLDLGANIQTDGSVTFRVWAPFLAALQVKIERGSFSLTKKEGGYFELNLSEVGENDLYTYILPNGQEVSDPVSRFLPQNVNGPSCIVNPFSFSWTDHDWHGIPQEELIFYECHVGTFSSEGSFEGIINKLPHLKQLGITCLELMPITQFPGRWGWGYDVSSLYSPHATYGSPQNLKKLINCCHREGIAVCLDVVYNHIGPEGCFLDAFGPYFSSYHQTPWGRGLNYDEENSSEVRHFILQNALYWIQEYHVDALRLDALHALQDSSRKHFLQELSLKFTDLSKTIQRLIYLIAESDLNDSAFVRPVEIGGYGLQALWSDDFHHALHSTLTRENTGYYLDFHGLKDLKKALLKGVVYEGEYSLFHKRKQGNSFKGIAASQLVVFSQNHDQIGNRPMGDRLTEHLSFAVQKVSAMLLLLSPYLPLLFMGQEYGEEIPFLYFTDYKDPKLLEKVYQGRKKEFHLENSFLPFPDESSYVKSKLSWEIESSERKALLQFHQELISLRKQLKFRAIKRIHEHNQNFLSYESFSDDGTLFIFFYTFSSHPQEFFLPLDQGRDWYVLLHTEQEEFLGTEILPLNRPLKKICSQKPFGAVFSSSLGSNKGP